MLTSPEFALEDRDDIVALVRQHPWAMVASAVDAVPVVSHAPVLLDGAEDDAVSIVSHLARPDARAHLHGVAEILAVDATWEVLERTVERFEVERPQPWSLATVADDAHRIAPGTGGFRLRSSRMVAKAKLSQDKPEEVVRSVIAGLDRDEVHGNTELAATMRSQLPAPDGERT